MAPGNYLTNQSNRWCKPLHIAFLRVLPSSLTTSCFHLDCSSVRLVMAVFGDGINQSMWLTLAGLAERLRTTSEAP